MSLLFKGAEQLLLRFMEKTKCSSISYLPWGVYMNAAAHSAQMCVCESYPICPPILQRILAENFFLNEFHY